MDYDTNPTEVLSRARRYLDYADSLGKNGSVRVGLWLAGWNETGAAYNPGDMSRDEADLEAEMAGLRAQLAVHPSFKDFAVFTDSGGPGSPTPSDLEPWKDQSVRKPSRGPFSRAGQVRQPHPPKPAHYVHGRCRASCCIRAARGADCNRACRHAG